MDFQSLLEEHKSIVEKFQKCSAEESLEMCKTLRPIVLELSDLCRDDDIDVCTDEDMFIWNVERVDRMHERWYSKMRHALDEWLEVCDDVVSHLSWLTTFGEKITKGVYILNGAATCFTFIPQLRYFRDVTVVLSGMLSAVLLFTCTKGSNLSSRKKSSKLRLLYQCGNNGCIFYNVDIVMNLAIHKSVEAEWFKSREDVCTRALYLFSQSPVCKEVSTATLFKSLVRLSYVCNSSAVKGLIFRNKLLERMDKCDRNNKILESAYHEILSGFAMAMALSFPYQAITFPIITLFFLDCRPIYARRLDLLQEVIKNRDFVKREMIN